MPVETGLGRPPVQLEHRRLVRLVAKALRAHLARNCGRCFVRGWLQNCARLFWGGGIRNECLSRSWGEHRRE